MLIKGCAASGFAAYELLIAVHLHIQAPVSLLSLLLIKEW
jgi:hypothetical protein